MGISGAPQWRARTVFAAVILLAVSLASLLAQSDALTVYEVQSQDVPVLVALCLSVLATSFWAPSWQLKTKLLPWWALVGAAAAIAAFAASGAYAVFANYSLSRDEHMVLFDMAVYEKGRLAFPLQPFWRPYARALVPDFLLSDRMPIGLVSAYLPLNALLRLAFSKIADPAWFNPLLAVAGGFALFDIVRRLFGPDSRASWVALAVYGLSAQMLINAMTPFSMTGHMALNLIWLAAFLRGGKSWTVVAILMGIIATGFHQLVFHPFFVAPFLLWKLRQGEWRLVSVYAAAYAAIILCWAFYPLLASAEAASVAGAAANDDFWRERVLPLLTHRTPGTTGLMVMNLVRFTAWQHFALLPLLIAAVPVSLRQRGLPGVLLLGIVAWLAFVTLVLPYQGLGWGFRYLSGYLGSFAILAAYGYRDLEARLGARADGIVIVLSALTTVVSIPFLLVTTERFAEPYIVLERLIKRQQTPFVLINTEVTPAPDDRWTTHPFGQVRNLPDLSNRPLRFSSNQMDPELLARLCGRGPVTLITRRDMQRVGFEANVPEPSSQFDGLIRAAAPKAPGCFRKAT